MNREQPDSAPESTLAMPTFGLTWPGKAEAWQAAFTPVSTHLHEVTNAHHGHINTRNLLIEGDNLDALKLLLPQYAGAVKLIYIDPPYNTGNPLLYRDNFRSSSDIGPLIGSEWVKAHGAWLSMMLPRLILARNMLREDGLIFISIGDEELDALTQICREIFGNDNFCGNLIWERKKKPSFLDAKMGRITEYIVCFAKDRNKAPAFNAGTVTLGKKYPFNNAGNGLQILNFPAQSVSFGCRDGEIAPQDMSGGNIQTELLDKVTIRNGINQEGFRLKGEWRYAQATLDALLNEGAHITISKVPFRPNLISRSTARKKTASLLSYRTNGIPTNEDATTELRQLFGVDIMPYPKPSGLLAYLVDLVTNDGDVVMDFFAGSGSTAHGLWRADIARDIRRQFILVQSPEPTRQKRANNSWKTSIAWDNGYHTIFAITHERLKRTSQALAGTHIADLGFRTLRVSLKSYADNA